MKGKEKLKKAAEQVGAKVKKGTEKQYQDIAEKATRWSHLPKDALGLNDAMIEGIYGQAYRLYNTGKYDDASQLFRLLIMLNPTESKYVMGLAASFHMMKEYQNAANTYAICSVIDPNDPIPHFHASDCYYKMGDKMSAMLALEMAVKQAGERETYAKIKDRAALALTGLKKEYDKALKKMSEGKAKKKKK